MNHSHKPYYHTYIKHNTLNSSPYFKKLSKDILEYSQSFITNKGTISDKNIKIKAGELKIKIKISISKYQS